MSSYFPVELSHDGGARQKFIIFVDRAANLDAHTTKEAFEELGYHAQVLFVDGDPRQVVTMQTLEAPVYKLVAEGVSA